MTAFDTQPELLYDCCVALLWVLPCLTCRRAHVLMSDEMATHCAYWRAGDRVPFRVQMH